MIVLAQAAVFWTAATVLLSWLLPRRLQMPAVAVSTCAFLAGMAPAALAVLAVEIPLVLWALPRIRRRGILAAGLAGLLAAALAGFKLGLRLPGMGALVVPLGLSFMTFRLIHLLVDGYAGRLPSCGTGDLLSYLLFLPPLPVGPIHRLPEFLADLRRRRFDGDMLGLGLERILHGYAKLVILRNLFILPVLVPALSGWARGTFRGDLLAAAGAWTDLYVCFSGISDLAVGYALAMGFRIQENFRFPFLAVSIPDFWRRWHMSLTLWCRDYVYAPVAAVTRRRFLGIAVAMVVIGLWHEVSLRYLLWGLYHAAGIAASHWLAERFRPWLPAQGRLARLLAPVGTLATLLFVLASIPVTSRLDAALRVLARHLA